MKPTLLNLFILLTLFSACKQEEKQQTVDLSQELSCKGSSDFYKKLPQLSSHDTSSEKDSKLSACLVFGCSLNDLPLLIQQPGEISREKILANTFTDEPWLKDRFGELLDLYPPYLHHMFNYVTAIVISVEAKPSHYNIKHGAIVLDGSSFWVNDEERATIAEGQDCRVSSLNSSLLEFELRHGLRVDNDIISFDSRSLESIELETARILTHELAHAMDFAFSWRTMNPNFSIYGNSIDGVKSQSVALNRKSDFSLNNPILSELAQVTFGATSKDSDSAVEISKSLDVHKVADEFLNSGAVALYSFFNEKEDFAMLIESTLMDRYYNLSYDAFGIEKEAKETDCLKKSIRWVGKSQQSKPLVQQRAQLAIEAIGLESFASFDDIDSHHGEKLLFTAFEELSYCDLFPNE